MHIHILGICGTFMGSLALLAREQGHIVSGCDENVYPPMSTQLQEQGIDILQGYSDKQFDHIKPDLVVIGNAMSRGNPAVEYVLNKNMPYMSGPQWLNNHVLQDKWVLAVSGTHGKTTTATMLAWLLEQAGMDPGFLIGGVPKNFDVSARLGGSPFFVIEADEYDSAFFDKRSKFVHYRPRTLVINNLEFDHADIFDSLADIQRQFNHLVRIVPSEGLIISPQGDGNIDAVLDKECWTPLEKTGVESGEGWKAELVEEDGSCFEVVLNGQSQGRVEWELTGQHNVANALAAIAAARHVGVKATDATTFLSGFGGVKRRMELLASANGVSVYDDFAHHPTAIATTLEGLRKKTGDETVVAVIEPRSNTMKMGVHREALLDSAKDADFSYWMIRGEFGWNLDEQVEGRDNALVIDNVDDIVKDMKKRFKGPGLHIVVMSNGSFDGIHGQLVEAFCE